MDPTLRAYTENKQNHPFLLVGIGASAGGVTALQNLFATIPPDTNMAFVVILHLSQEHESHLDAILQNQTVMPVLQVQEPVQVQPNHVYVIPPGKFLEMVDGTIRLRKLERIEGKRISIDHFFRTLAEAYGRRAIGIILSGTGTDGTLGMKHIKERNGFAMVQDPTTAAFDTMPRSAIHTGLVDVVLPIDKMAEKLLFVRDSTVQFNLVEANDEQVVAHIQGTDALRDIITLLRIRTGNDFSNYKQATILRRIARHLQIHELESINDYLNLLRERPDEVELLLHNLLINVTNFFRDPDAFEALEDQVIPRLFENKTINDTIRVWVPGCASGEEAYSIAMLLVEYADKTHSPPRIQIFASDVDEAAIAEARQGHYLKSITLDVSEERLRRFFIKEGDGYRIRKELRETILFAPHNILRDPPFSRLDLISCRNVFIYLNRPTQDKVLQLFHFALRPQGYLLLGSSESAEGHASLFDPINKKQRIYIRQGTKTNLQLPLNMPASGNLHTKPVVEISPINREKIFSFGEFHHRLVEQYAPPSVLVNEDFEVVHLSEHAGRYLRFSGGEPTSNLLKVLHPDLQLELRAALFTAQQENHTVEVPDVRVQLDGTERFVTMTVHAVRSGDSDPLRGFLLIVFKEHAFPLAEERSNELNLAPRNDSNAAEEIIRRLEEELERTKDRLRNTIEQYETALEELKASNEELQAINEELRSATEELETSKEEMQSVNEELTTVNHELKETLEEVSHTNADLQNLMISTRIATVFLDRALQIKRFTPEAQRLFNVLHSDIGRPIAHLTHMLEYDDLISDANEVLKNLQTIEREVRSVEGSCYIARLLPYRTIKDRIDGVVVTFMDITERARAEAALRESETKYRSLFNSIDEGFCIIERVAVEPVDFRYLEANPAFAVQSGVQDVIGKTIRQVAPGEPQEWFDIYDRVLQTREPLRFERELVTTGRVLELYAFPVTASPDARLAVIFKDVSERKRREQQQEFLLKLADALRAEPNADAMTNRALQMLSEQMQLDRCYVGVYRLEEDRGDFTHQVGNERVPPVPASVRLSDFPAALQVAFDRTLVIENAAVDEGLSDTDKRNLDALGLGALIAATLRKGEHNPFWSIVVVSASPRQWTRGEVALVEEVVERTWAAVERARAEEALRAREVAYALLVENLPDVIFQLDRELRHLYISPTIESIIKKAPSEWLGKTALEMGLPANAFEVFKEQCAQVFATGQEAHMEFEFEKKIYRTRIIPEKKAGDFIHSIMGITEDITEQKKAQQALRESEARLQRALQIETVGVIFFTVDGDITYANNAFLRMSGYTRADVARRLLRWDDMTPDEWMPLSLKAIDEFMKFGRTTPYEKEYLRKDGTRWWALFAATRLNNEEGVEFIIDITERKQAEEAVRESEERLHLILESVEDYAIFTTDLNGIITRWNSGAQNVFGYTQTEAVGQLADITFTPEDVAAGVPAQERARALETGRAVDERWHLKKNGTRFFASGVTTLLRDSYVHGFVKIARDLTFQKQLEETLLDADRKKNDFLATLAHELRNPLTPIRAALEVINHSDDRDQEQKARAVIERQIRKIVILVDDLLEISRISRGKVKLEKEVITLQEAVRDALEMTDPLMKAAKHHFTLNLPEEPIYLHADRDRIAQIIVNVVGNAIKYTHTGGEISLTVAVEKNEAVIRVSDNGVGIPLDRLENIFELFNQVEQIGKKFQTGLGIGLSLVKNLVEMHGGTISAHSEGEGKGSEFVVRLPLAPQRVEGTLAAEHINTKTAKKSTARILVVEDDVDIAEMLQAVLELEGHEVAYVHTGSAALEVVPTFQPQAMLIDIGLPDIDGYEVARRLRQDFPTLWLIAHSGWGAEEDRQRSKEAGFNVHLVKPAEVDEIMAVLEQRQ